MDKYLPSDSHKVETFGRLFFIPKHKVEETMKYLDIREIAGYEKAMLDIHCLDGRVISALVFYATHENTCFVAGESEEEIADIISHSIGPSGRNSEYLFNLCQMIREQGLIDSHLFAIEEAVHKKLSF